MCFKRKNKITMTMMQANEVRSILVNSLKGKLVEYPVIILSDYRYMGIDIEQMRKIYRVTNLKKILYRPEVYDCDDYSVELKSIVADAARMTDGVIAPYAFGIVYGDIPTPHAINWFITPKKKLLFIEPQTGEIFDPTGNNIIFLYT